jgi:hypothetical protein
MSLILLTLTSFAQTANVTPQPAALASYEALRAFSDTLLIEATVHSLDFQPAEGTVFVAPQASAGGNLHAVGLTSLVSTVVPLHGWRRCTMVKGGFPDRFELELGSAGSGRHDAAVLLLRSDERVVAVAELLPGETYEHRVVRLGDRVVSEVITMSTDTRLEIRRNRNSIDICTR